MKRTAANLISVIGGEVLLRGANFMAAVVIARLYGAYFLGIYATVLAYVTVAERLADNGIEISSIADVSRSPSTASELLGSRYALKLLLSMLVVLAMASLGFLARIPTDVWIIGAFLTARVVLYSLCRLNAGFLKALDKMAAIGIAQGLNFFVIVAGIGVVYLRALSLSVLLTWLLVGQILEMFVSSFCLSRVGVRPGHFSMSGWWPLLRSSTPVGLTYTVGTLILRSDVIILALFVPVAAVGHFAAADMGLVMVYVVAWLFGGVVLAEMARLCHDPVALQRYCRRWVMLLLSTTIPSCLLLALVAPRLVPLFYGPDYVPAGLIAGVMSLSIPLILLNAVYLSRAIATASVRTYLGTYIGVGALTVALNLAFGRYYGALGVSVAIVIRELTMLTAFIVMGTSPAGSCTNEPAMAAPSEPLRTIDA